jgi:hypothetical protein
MLLKTSFISRVLLSLIFICWTWSRFWYLAIMALSGRETTMTATWRSFEERRGPRGNQRDAMSEEGNNTWKRMEEERRRTPQKAGQPRRL